MRQHPIEDPDGDARDEQDRTDRRRERGELVPFPLIDVDRLERERAAASARLVVAGDVVAELERQHRRAYRRRQEKAARRRRYRGLLENATLGLIAVAGAVALIALAAELSGPR